MFSDVIHKIVTYLTSPAFVGMCGIIAAFVVPWMINHIRRIRWARSVIAVHSSTSTIMPYRSSRTSTILFAISLLWLYCWSLPLTTWFIGVPLEQEYPPQQVEAIPSADAICLLGGGMGINTNNEIYANMADSADRAWHAARLYKAGKAPKITLTGPRVRKSTPPLLRDLGVPDKSFVIFEDGANTEDEARMISNWLYREYTNSTVNLHLTPKILLVTSAWHMRRAKWLFEHAGLEVIPAACDYVAYGYLAPLEKPWYFLLVPDVRSLGTNTFLFKEHFAYWCYYFCDWLGVHK